MSVLNTERAWYHKLEFQLGLPFYVTSVLLACTIALLMASAYVNDQKNIDDAPRIAAQESKETLVTFFESLQFNLLLVARSIHIPDVRPADITLLKQLVASDASIMELRVVDVTGEELFIAQDVTMPSLLSHTSAYSEDLKRATETGASYISNPEKTIFNTYSAVWSIPIHDADGRVAGALRATIDVSSLWDQLNKRTRDEHTVLYIVDADGAVLVSNKSLENIAVNRSRDIAYNLRQFEPHYRYKGLFGENVSGRAELLPPTAWMVIAEIPLYVLSASTRLNIILFVVLGLIFIVLTYYSFRSFRSNLTIPLAELTRKATRLSLGNYKTQVIVRTKNQFALLAGVINVMAKNIDIQTAESILRLKRTVNDLDRSSKLLVRRDVELTRANEKLLTLDSAKSEFVSIAAHQLRTPLSAIKWAQQMLLDGELGTVSPEQKVMIGQSQESIERMVSLVNDLLSADHLENDKVQYIFTEINIVSVIRDIIGEMKLLADERVISLRYKTDAPEYRIVGDINKLKEAFLNIFNNAIKYTPIRGRVDVSIYAEGNTVIVEIRDTGIGIPERDQGRLFGKFVRMDNAKRINANGSGLGLFITKKIIDAHGGSIRFVSVEGKGTTFYCQFDLVTEAVHTLATKR